MDMKVSSLKTGGLSPSDCVSDPEEKEVSDEDDDDRNHKHRRRETRSQSLERDSAETVFSRPYRKRNKPFENGHSFRENESQVGESWRNYNINPLERDYTKFEKRRPGFAPLSRVPLDFNQRIRPNQTFSGEAILGRGRGREPWNQRDSRFNADITSQMQHPITPSLFPGRGLPNVSNAQSASWNAFGLIPGVPNGGLDTLHSIGLQGTLRPTLSSSLNMGIPRQRCRDFEERGFCLRGDMCPMEHGVNRIVIEDVQSLSQFNLPVSIPNAQMVGTPAGPGSLPPIGAPSATLMNSKGVHSKSNKGGMTDDGLGLNGAYSGPASLGGADLYDPDQPLWNNNGPEASSTLLAIHSPGKSKAVHSPRNEETESLMSVDPSDRHHMRLRDNTENEGPTGSTGLAVGSQSSTQSVWGRIGSLKNRHMKEKNDLASSSSDYFQNQTKEDLDASTNVQGTSHQGKRIAEDVGPRITTDSTVRTQSDPVRNMRKPSQKALRTLFVNGIPQKSNKKESLLSHFQKFGEVVDIYIPSNSERAFVQFSKREEAEAALRSPDAVMGNRFIKLWWANRDSIAEDGISNSNNAFTNSRGVTASLVLSQPLISNKGKDNLHSASKSNIVAVSDPSLPSADHPKPNGPKAPPPLHKKLELEQLKEELRKKQELLDQKRNDFRRKLDKLEKQTSGIKGEAVSESASKRLKVGIANDDEKVTTPRSSDAGATVASSPVEMIIDKNKSADNVVSSNPRTNVAFIPQEFAGSKQTLRPLAPVAAPFLMNRYKLDNRPTSFRIVPPLPIGLANVSALKEHFSSFGDVSSVDIDDAEPFENDQDGSELLKHCSARVTFITRRSAERAFVNGKCWQGNTLQFVWVTSDSTGNETGVRENPTATPKCAVDADIHPAERSASTDSQGVCVSGSGEPEQLERSSGVGHLELHDASEPCSTSMSSEKESTRLEHSVASVSGEEELLKCEPGPSAISGEKESPKGASCE